MKDYKIPGTDQIIEKGIQLIIPASSLHMDEIYYKDPEKFNPDRFLEKNSVGNNFNKRPFLTFGDGPKLCIGIRLAKMTTRCGLVMMLQKFRFELDSKLNNRKMRFDPKAMLMASLDGIDLRVFRR